MFRNVAFLLIVWLAAFLAAGALIILPRYFRDLAAARKKLAGQSGRTAETACGPIEYALSGSGSPVLVIHGAMGGFDQGLMLARDALGPSFQTIAVSRYGYLGSPRPERASLDSQVDAYACLLDELGIEKAVVFGTSAGATSAIRFAARHPERTAALILLSPAAPGDVVPPDPPLMIFDKFLRSEFVYWFALTYFRQPMARMMGIPQSLVLTPAMQAELDEAMATTLPVAGRIDGMLSDFTLAPDEFRTELSNEAPYPLKEVRAPVLIMNALDDPLALPGNVDRMAKAFPNSARVIFPDGGHMLLGRGRQVREETKQFLEIVPAKVDAGS